MIERLLGIILPVFSIIAVGYLWGRRAKPDMAQVNRISMNVLAPALIFSALSSKSFDVRADAVLMAASVGIVLGSGLLAWPLARLLREDPRTFVPPVMFNNCGNMGLPLAVLTFGQAGFGPMVAMFVISNLLHFTLGAWIIDHKARFGTLLRNPMVWSTVVGFAFALLQPPLPTWFETAVRMTGDGLIPLMLLSLGVRLTDINWADAKLGIAGGIACPLTGLICAGALWAVLDMTPTQAGLLFVFAALPPAVLNFMVAEQYRQEPGKVASMVLVGNLLSVIFVPIGVALALRA